MLTAALSAPLSVPFEIAKMAYYGDKTFPKELQKGYKSYFNALIRIPFEEGCIYKLSTIIQIIISNIFNRTLLFI